MKINKTTILNLCGRAVLSCLAATAMCGCDGFIYEDTDVDCEPHYKVRFRYDMNMKYADAFPAEVNAVTLYLIGEDGRIVWQKSESGEELRKEGYLMDVDGVAPGTYTMLAWCGDGAGGHFEIPSDASHHTHLTTTLQRGREADGSASIRYDVDRLYHGRVDSQEFTDEWGVHIYTVPLIKDTNDVNIVLQHLSGLPVDHNKFTFTLTDANGSLDWDNTLRDDEDLTYYAHHKYSGTAGVITPEMESRAQTSVSAAIAELTVSRLMADRDMMLNIYNDRQEKIVSVPFTDYALLVKGNHNSQMTDQEYLDRQDKYDLVFFLDEKDHWMNAYIYINSWRVVLQNTEF